MDNRFLIISTGYNCQGYADRLYRSLLIQGCYWRAVLVDDGSTDGTRTELEKIADERVTCISFDDNMGAAYRRLQAIRQFGEPEDIVVLVGMDDYLMPTALQRIGQEYDNGKWCSFGNWKNQIGIGLPVDFKLEFDEHTHKTRDYRKVQFRSTAPNSFKKWLFDKINPEDFKFEDQWIMATTESPLMFACLEMCGKDRIGVIHEHVYIYDQRRKDNARTRFGYQYQLNVYNHVISIPKYDQVMEAPI